MFENLPTAPPDSILGLAELFNKDPRSNKVNLTSGVYRDEQGLTPVLETVKEAEKRLIASEKSKTYLGIDGHPDYLRLVVDLVLGKSIDTSRVAAIQSPGGTGALRLGAETVAKFFPSARIWVSNPTWANHNSIFEAAGLKVETYKYLGADKLSLDADAMLEQIEKEGREGDLICLHACCHNPTGIDLTATNWTSLSELLLKKRMIPFVDYAYQGFGDGIDQDGAGLREIIKLNPEVFICSSFSKNFGLYSERVGAFLAISGKASSTEPMLSQLKQTVRANYSNPPRHGASVVATILADSGLRKQWEAEVAAMRSRIAELRTKFVEGMANATNKRDFSFLLKQRGMFSYTGLTPTDVDWLKKEKAVYLVGTGRINVAGISQSNLDYLCESIAECLAAA
jgi:aspartate aminotransferase/aromatic-amino-acid transaminase